MRNMSALMKLVIAVLALCAAVCCIIAFWDNLRDAFDYAQERLRYGVRREEQDVEFIDLNEQ